MTAVLRHAGSATGHTPGASYGNQQYTGHGLAKLCDCCGRHDDRRPVRVIPWHHCHEPG